MRSLCWDVLQIPWFRLSSTNMSLEAVCILLLDLVVALAKFLLVSSSLLKIHHPSPFFSWHPSLRAFPWWSFVMSFPCQFRLLGSLVGQKTHSWHIARKFEVKLLHVAMGLRVFGYCMHLVVYMETWQFVSLKPISTIGFASSRFLCQLWWWTEYQLCRDKVTIPCSLDDQLTAPVPISQCIHQWMSAVLAPTNVSVWEHHLTWVWV